MPSVSQKQHNAMEAAAHGQSNLGIPKKVGQEFSAADKGKKMPKKKNKKHLKKSLGESLYGKDTGPVKGGKAKTDFSDSGADNG